MFNNLLVVQDLWDRKEARSSVNVTKETYGWQQFHLPAPGDKVSTKSQAYSQAVSHGESAVYCTFKSSFSHGLVLKPNQTQNACVANRSLSVILHVASAFALNFKSATVANACMKLLMPFS